MPAIEGHAPDKMVQAMHAFLEFCYIARRNIHDTHSLESLDDALQRFHECREIFQTSRIHVDGFNLPQQHSLVHYAKLIRAYGSPNGLCLSITESKHINLVKWPFWRLNRYNTLPQMLLMNQHNDKLSASHVDFSKHGMLEGNLEGTSLSSIWDWILHMFSITC